MVATDKFFEQVRAISAQYGLSRVVLFGSCLTDPGEARDVDIGVRGLPPELFFDYYGALISKSPCPVDIVDLEDDSLFTRLIERDGKVLYEAP